MNKSILFIFSIIAIVAIADKHNWSYKTWAVLIAGNDGWDSYPIQSSMYKMYQLLRDAGVSEDHIITFFADDIAYHNDNPFPGHVYNDNYVEGGRNVDVYKGIVKDYIGNNATTDNLVKVLAGKTPSSGSGKVLLSTDSDNVLFYYVGIGYHGSLYYADMPNGRLFRSTVSDIVNNMRANNMYKKLMIVADCNYSSDIFSGIDDLKKLHNVYVLTSLASGYIHNSPNCLHDIYIHNYVTRCWSHTLTSDIEAKGLSLTVESLYSDASRSYEWTCQLGDADMKNMTLSTFLKNRGSRASFSQPRMPPLNIPGLSFCDYGKCTESSCDCYAICNKRGYGYSRCQDYCCVNYNCYLS